MNNYIKTRYQGKEFTATIQAPNIETLNQMISEMEDYAKQFEMGEVKILEKGVDPDGGYKAIVTAHNFNPFKWIKNKIELSKAKNYAEKVQIKAMQKKREQVEKAEKQQKQEEKRKKKLESLKFKAQKRSFEAKIGSANRKIRKSKTRTKGTKRSSGSLNQLMKGIVAGIQESGYSPHQSNTSISISQQRREFIRQSEISVAYPVGNNMPGYQILTLNNGNLKSTYLPGDLPQVTQLEENRNNAYKAMENLSGFKINQPQINLRRQKLPRISPKTPRISLPNPKIR